MISERYRVRRHLVIWQPPNHQAIHGGDHPTGHGCEVCTTTYPAEVVGRAFTSVGARRKAERLNAWSLTPGRFYAGDVLTLERELREVASRPPGLDGQRVRALIDVWSGPQVPEETTTTVRNGDSQSPQE